MSNSYNRQINLFINGKQIRNDVSSITKEMQKIRNEMARMTIGSQEYMQKMAEWKKLNAILQKHQAEIKNTGNSWLSLSKIADKFNKYQGMLVGFMASFAGVALGVKSAIDSFNDFEERVDNLSALTGLAGDDLKWLSDQAKQLSTATLESGIRITQSAKDIVDAFTKTGSARPELLKNKQALVETTKEAIILANAGKTELQPAIEALTMVMNQYNVPATEARRIINSLAAGSKEGAGEIPYLTTAFEKAGTVAADAGISIETLVATIETLAPRISQPEIAGRSLKGVLLDLQAGANDTNPAIVGLSTALENLAAKNLSSAQLTKMFGAENITTAKILINNVGELKKYEAAVTGTNVAIEQAAINTDNNNAKLAQAKNRINLISMELGEKLSPAYAAIVNKTSLLLKSVSGIVDITIKYGKTILMAASAIAGYAVAVKVAAASDGAWFTVKKLLTGQINLATIAQKGFNLAMKANPIGLIVGALAAGITYLVSWNQKTGRLNDDLEEIGEQFRQIANWFINIYNNSLLVRAVFEQMIAMWKTGFAVVSVALKTVWEQLKLFGKLLEGVLTQDFGKIKQAFLDYNDNMKDAIVASAKKVGKTWANAYNNTVSGELQPIRQKIVVSTDIAGPDNYSPKDASAIIKEIEKKITWKPDPELEKKAFEATMKALDEANNERINKLKEQYLKEKITQEDYHNDSILAELAYLMQKKAMLEAHKESTNNIESQILDKQIAVIEEMKKNLIEGNEALKKFFEQNQNEIEDAIKKQGDSGDDVIAKAIDESVDQGTQAIKDMEDLKDKESDILKQRADAYMDLAQNIGESFEEMLLTQEMSFGQFLKNTLMMALDALEKVMVMSIAEATIQATLKAGVLSPIFLAKSIAKIIAIKAAFGLAKAAVMGKSKQKGYSSGGYTGDGSLLDPAGIVHRGEYVVPQSVMGDPVAAPALRSLEMLRQRKITASPALAAIRYASGGAVSPPGSTNNLPVSAGSPAGAGGISDPELKELIRLNIAATRKLLQWQPTVATTLIRRDLDTLNDIDRNRGL